MELVRASKRAYEEFLTSGVWLDMKQWLTDRLLLVRDDLENRDDDKLRGEAKTIRAVLSWPDMMVEDYEKIRKEDEECQTGLEQGQERLL